MAARRMWGGHLALREWLPEGKPGTVLLAASVETVDAEKLASQGIVVQSLDVMPGVDELAAAAIGIRRRWPRARLVVAGPERLTRQLRERYPPAIDVAVTSSSAAEVLAAIVAP